MKPRSYGGDQLLISSHETVGFEYDTENDKQFLRGIKGIAFVNLLLFQSFYFWAFSFLNSDLLQNLCCPFDKSRKNNSFKDDFEYDFIQCLVYISNLIGCWNFFNQSYRLKRALPNFMLKIYFLGLGPSEIQTQDHQVTRLVH